MWVDVCVQSEVGLQSEAGLSSVRPNPSKASTLPGSNSSSPKSGKSGKSGLAPHKNSMLRSRSTRHCDHLITSLITSLNHLILLSYLIKHTSIQAHTHKAC